MDPARLKDSLTGRLLLEDNLTRSKNLRASLLAQEAEQTTRLTESKERIEINCKTLLDLQGKILEVKKQSVVRIEALFDLNRRVSNVQHFIKNSTDRYSAAQVALEEAQRALKVCNAEIEKYEQGLAEFGHILSFPPGVSNATS